MSARSAVRLSIPSAIVERPVAPVHVDDIEAVPATREGIILFARLMVARGTVSTFGAHDDSLNANRLAAHADDADGYTVAFLSVVHGEPEVTHHNFDFGDRAHRHLLHTDGLGLTLCDYRSVPYLHYRVAGAPLNLADVNAPAQKAAR